MTNSTELMKRAREALLSKKGVDVKAFDVRAVSPVTDYYMVVSGATGAQLKAMANAIIKDLKETGGDRPRFSGTPDDGWIVVDCFDVVIHIFQQEKRVYYAIEELWADCPQAA